LKNNKQKWNEKACEYKQGCKHKCTNEDNKVFIKYSLNNIEEDLNVSKKTAGVLLKELETIGLIDMVKLTGVANVIYVKNFVSEDKSSARKTPVKEVHQDNNETGEDMQPVEKLPR